MRSKRLLWHTIKIVLGASLITGLAFCLSEHSGINQHMPEWMDSFENWIVAVNLIGIWIVSFISIWVVFSLPRRRGRSHDPKYDGRRAVMVALREDPLMEVYSDDNPERE